MDFDPRLTPARPEIAARHLEGRVQAARFVTGEPREVVDPLAPVRSAPSHDAALTTEALFGEAVTVYEWTEEGWAWGQLAGDGYVGWLPANALNVPGPPPTHKVTALRTLAFPAASMKLSPLCGLALGCRVAVTRLTPPWAITSQGWHIPSGHLAPLDWRAGDIAGVAELFAGVPYLWGGKTSLGIDCSGLVQIAVSSCGVDCPRDSDMQEAALGRAVDPRAGLRRGDLVFWPGHVGIMRDAELLLHANAFHMAVTSEPLAAALERIRAAGAELRSVRRIELAQ